MLIPSFNKLSLEKLVVTSQEPLLDQGEEKSGNETRRREMEELLKRQREKIDFQTADLIRVRGLRDKFSKGYQAAGERIAVLENAIFEASEAHEEALRRREHHIQAIEEQLALTKELLDTRTRELSGAQSFLSTTDRISEAEVLGIVRDLNENIFQTAANLTEEWEKFRESRSSPRLTITDDDIHQLSQTYGPALVYETRARNTPAVTLLIQSCLCDLATQLSSSWKYNQQLNVLNSVYQRISTSGKHPLSMVCEMRLTHTRGTSDLSQMEVVDPQ